MSFEVFHSRLVLSGILELRSGLHIGASSAPVAAGCDKTVIRDRHGNPFIPGSSLKGVVRAAAASILRQFPDRERAGLDLPCLNWACADDLNADEEAAFAHRGSCFVAKMLEPGSSQQSQRDNKRSQLRSALGLSSSPDDEIPAWQRDELAERCICRNCRLFGSPSIASKVRILDAPLDDPDAWLHTEVRDGVGINRDTRTAAHGVKYDFEVIPAGTTFGLNLTLSNADAHELGMLLLGFDSLHDGVTRLGGITSRGLGRVVVRWTKAVRWDAASMLKGQPAPVEEGEIDRHLETARVALRQAVLPAEEI